MNEHEEDHTHTRLRELLGPYVLGGLDADDRARLKAHLPTCAACRDELATYAGLPALLRDGAPASAHRETSDAALGDAVGALRTRRRRRRLQLTAAAAVALVAGAGVGTALVLGPDTPVGTTLALGAPAGVSATGATSLSAKPWGTSVELDLRGLPQDEQFIAWLVSPEGERQQVATWGSTGNGEAHVTGAAAFVTRDVAQVRVTDSDGDLVLSTTTR
ncbi:anti-sigma factor family protein [Nocardioides aurantiacus]|uniref:Putative zinc finger protein n=1 Tax=Nocardioides aurantiacus TaxID=86796 RepID=A0A3N2CTK9_9ACTN|nr:zf-HC2 domain-containing protein [Nocardioides aurantiacus]ROR90872.1 putative zinc finger protein [Nocardioides aurantiacus]